LSGLPADQATKVCAQVLTILIATLRAAREELNNVCDRGSPLQRFDARGRADVDEAVQIVINDVVVERVDVDHARGLIADAQHLGAIALWRNVLVAPPTLLKPDAARGGPLAFKPDALGLRAVAWQVLRETASCLSLPTTSPITYTEQKSLRRVSDKGLAISKKQNLLADPKHLTAGTIMARKKPRKKTSVRAKRRAAPLKAQSQFVRREHSQGNGQAEEALMPPNPFWRVVGVYLELPFRLAKCTTPFQVWAEQMRASQQLLSAWQPRSAQGAPRHA
jgi:hypothetical protein